MEQGIIYLDNAAGSFPKPESVYVAVDKAMRKQSGNPGRSGHNFSLTAGKIIEETRLLCARLFHANSPNEIIFTNNTTTALNIAIKGLIGGIIKPGCHILTSTFEHNSVSRPLHHLESIGVEVTKLPVDVNYGLNVDDIKNALKPTTKLLVCTHISNVTGTVNDISSIGAFCRENGILFLVDAAQSAGKKLIDVQEMCIDMLAFPGQKSLLGPQGTGGLYIRPGLELKTIIQGGTGSNSESPLQPESLPNKFESGTQNAPGLAGLAAGIQFIFDTGIENIEKHEAHLIKKLIEGMSKIEGIRLIGPGINQNRGSIVSFCIDNKSPANAALLMDSAFHIAVRGGLHCAPDTHRSLGTLDKGGTIRISPSYFNSKEDINTCLNALEFCAGS